MTDHERISGQGLPPEIEELIALHGDIRNVPVTREFNTPSGPRSQTLTVEQWMKAFCPEDTDTVSDEEFQKTAIKFILGESHGTSEA